MDITLVGPGRAGMALAIAALEAGHVVSGVWGTSQTAAEVGCGRRRCRSTHGRRTARQRLFLPAGSVCVTRRFGRSPMSSPPTPPWFLVLADPSLRGLPPSTRWRRSRPPARPSVHSTRSRRCPPPRRAVPGGGRGAWIGVTAGSDRCAAFSIRLLLSLGARPFDLPDDAKALYHAAAAAAANFPLAALTMAHDLFRTAGVPFEAARPLVEAVVANAFELGLRAKLHLDESLAGDSATVAAQLRAVRDAEADWLGPFEVFVEVLARLVGRGVEFSELIDAIEEEPTK